MKGSMRIDRRFLYLGVFLIALGAVLVSADVRVVDTATLTAAVRLWPVALVAIGVGLVLRRTPAGLTLGVVGALVPGVVLGAGLAAIPRYADDCGTRAQPQQLATDSGTFVGPASVEIVAGCGTLTVTTAPGDGWRVDVASTSPLTPELDATSDSLTVDSFVGQRFRLLDGRRDALDVTLPQAQLGSLALAVYGGHGTADLAGTTIGRLELTANAGELVTDLSGSAVETLHGEVNVGALTVRLGERDLHGEFEIGGGALRICTPPGLAIRLETSGQPRSVSVDGLRQSGADWESPDYDTALHRADLTVHADFGSVDIDPIGGC
jgi:hypothetical protein